MPSNKQDLSKGRTPVRSLSVSDTSPKHSNSITHSKATAFSVSEYWRPQSSDIPHLTKTPWEVGRYKKNSTWRRSTQKREFPAHIFEKLPREIYECIVTQLEKIHLHRDQACPSCYLRDLHSLSLTSRAWDKAVTPHLYIKIYVPGHENHSGSTKTKAHSPGRLKLLRRTLRERYPLARRVHELHLPGFQTLYQQAAIERKHIINLVASLVMACPLLERLVGFHIPFTQGFDRLSYSLATRPKLRERVWLLSEPEYDYAFEEDDDEVSYYLAARDPTEHFLSLNSGHSLLTTLVIHRYPGDISPNLNFRAMVGTLRQLPSLQHLSISGLPATSFTNLALNSLPPGLLSLRLENVLGINDKGLQKFLTSCLSSSIERLALINLELTSLNTIANILSDNLGNLRRFTISQYRTPDLGSRMPIPNLASPRLHFLHFEFRSQAGPAVDPFSPGSRKSMDFPFVNTEPISCLAISLLATNIKGGAFPALRRVRVPFDPQGLIQALCKPRATALLASDTSFFTRPLQKLGSHGYAYKVEAHVESRDSSPGAPLSPRADSAIESPTFDTNLPPSTLSPSKIRITAQARILAARKVPLMQVRVYDPEGEICIDSGIGGYIGDLKSNIVYDLAPDASRWPGNLDQSGPPQPEWTVGIEDLVDERTAPSEWVRERLWGSCGHRVGGRVGINTVRVGELF